MFKRGTQVMYAPEYARDEKGMINEAHPAVEYGFITKYKRGDALARVRYFRKDSDDLRTKSGSELTPIASLFEYNSRPQEVIDKLLREIENNWHELPMNV